MIDLEGYSRKLKELKRKAQDATIENRLLVDRESKDIESSGKPRVYNMQDDQDNQLETQEEDADDKVAKLAYELHSATVRRMGKETKG